jgi:hypothetical protein
MVGINRRAIDNLEKYRNRKEKYLIKCESLYIIILIILSMTININFNRTEPLYNSLCNLSRRIEQRCRNRYILIVGFILLAGAIIRSMPLLLLGLPHEIPYNGGGLYYAFSTMILENDFHYPIDIPYYSSSGVPFAYNPLVFYLIAFIAAGLNISPFLLHIYLPTLFSIMSIILFFIFANDLFENKKIVLISTFLYCVLPQAFSELTPGEGLVESFGTMLFLFGVIALFRMYRGKKYEYCILSGILFGLITLGSPGGALAFAITLVVVPLFKEDIIPAVKTIISVSIIGAIISAPWWMAVVYFHGIGAIINGILVKNTSILGYLIKILGFNAGCGWLFGAALVLLGFTYCLILRKWLLPVWFILVFLAGEIGYIVPIVASFLMTIGLLKVILPSLNFVEGSKRGCHLLASILIILICIHGAGTALYYNTGFHYTTVPVSYSELRDVEIDSFSAISWARDNSNEDSRFFVVGDYNLWWVGDWLPVLVQKPVINVGYGSEWNGNLSKISAVSSTIIEQLKKGDISSSEKIANNYGTYFTYLFIVKSDHTGDLITTLRKNDYTKTAYENDRTIIFEVIPEPLVEEGLSSSFAI